MITNKDIMEELQVSKKEQKLRAQVKSRWYYIFWGTATVTVFVGQVFVGNGFRRMAESLDKVLEAPIQMDIGIPRRNPWEDHPMIIK
tara:strand:+ start:398 stop:658 length:261 start_codon:yes stop_codon:yes gene_type:complete